MFLNIIKSHRDIVAVCDSDLLGKYFEEGEFQLEIKENFYKGEEKSMEEVEKIMQYMKGEDATFNIVGEKSINCAIDVGIIDLDGVSKIQGIPFALTLL